MTAPDPLTLTGADGAPNLALDLQPSGLPGEFTVDADEVGGPALLGWGSTGWVNVVCDATRLRVRRGATRMQGVLTRTEAAEVSIDVLDTDRRFDPLVNADAVHAGTPLRVRAWQGTDPAAPTWSATLFTGELDDVPVTYDHDGPPRVTLQATDVIGAQLAPWRSTGRAAPGIGAGDNLLQRVTRVLGEVGVVDGLAAPAELDSGYTATHPPTTLADAWSTITAAADAELGRVWVNAAGKVVVRSRGSALSGTIRGTLSDWHGEAPTLPHCCYDALDAALGTELLINRTVGQRRIPEGVTADPALVQRDDTVSQAMYRTRTGQGGEQRSLELETDAQVVAWCEQVLAVSSLPELRIDRVTPAPWNADDAAWHSVCSTDLGDRWLLRYHPAIGPSVQTAVGILGLELEVTPEGWSIVWLTAPAPVPGENPTGWFAVDVSTIDSSDVLPTFGGPVPALEPVP